MKYLFMMIPLSLLILAGCHSGGEGKKGNGKNPQKGASVDFKKIENLRYGFAFRIPASWQALDLSDNGDGFVLKTPGASSVHTDIRIYGSYEPFSGEELSKDTLELFSFTDGKEGRALKDGNNFLVQRMLGEDRFVIFSVRVSSPQWINDHHRLLMEISESIVPLHAAP